MGISAVISNPGDEAKILLLMLTILWNEIKYQKLFLLL